MGFFGSLTGRSAGPINHWTQAQWQRFAKQLREAIRDYDVIDYNLLGQVPKNERAVRGDMEDARLDVWSKGGCYVLAKALQEWIGAGRILYIPSDDIGGFEHAFLECETVRGPVYLDDSGHAWTEVETESGVAWRFRAGARDGSLAPTTSPPSKVAAWQNRAAKSLKAVLLRRFGAFSKLKP